ncbi:MAG: gliding motility-associated C-terminal domain-containing protein [Bacteroidia bacterium]
MQKFTRLFIFFILLQSSAFAQYISRSEPVPYACPVICASGTLTLKINQIENLPAGSQIDALMSNAASSFATGTQVLPFTQYSTNAGATWQNGPYTFTANINNLFARIVIPSTTPPGTSYTIKIQASNGYISNDLFQCSITNFIAVTPYIAPLPPIVPNTQGLGAWNGHVYSWNPTTGATLNTAALVANQDFFNASNYQGHIIRNALNFDINFITSGGVPGTWNNGTSIGCGTSFSQNFSIRMLRQENFTPGFYQFTIQGDDGIRFSLDGGVTWILDSFIEQQYANSFKTTATANPNGICLSGPTDLVVEYFQRPAEARMTFTATQLQGSSTTNPTDLSLCEGENGSITAGSSVAGTTYQWQVSTDGGTTFNNVVEGGNLSGTTSTTLNFINVPASYDSYLYQCLISNACGQNVPTNDALLSVQSNPSISTQPFDQNYCPGQTIGFNVEADGTGLIYQWQVSTDGGNTYTNIAANPPYSGVNSSVLTIVGTPANLVGDFYQLIINGCGNSITSSEATILAGDVITINQQPLPVTVCQGQAASFSVDATGATSYQWQVDSGSGFNNINNANGYSNAQTSSLNLIGAATSVNGLAYQCILSGGCAGNLTTVEVVLTVNPNTNITNQPTDEVACEGDNVIFSLNANGSSLNFQWQVSTDGGASFSNIVNAPPYSGATTSSLTVTTPSMADEVNIYRCEVDGICGSAQLSNEVQFQITASPQVTLQPINQSACEGETVSFTSDISGNPQFQWMISTDEGATFTQLNNGNGVSGANTNVLTINSLSIDLNNAQFMLSAEACNNSASSTPAILTVSPLPTVELLLVPPPVCPGEDVQISVEAQNELTIQWQVNTGLGWNNVFNSGTYSGSNTETLSINNIPASLQNALYRAEVNSTCGAPVVSEEALLFLNGIPLLIASPLSQVACSGGAVSFQTVAQGEGIDFQWQQLNEDGSFTDLQDEGFLSGTSTPVMQAEAVTELNNLIIRCVISGCGDVIETDTARLVIYQNDPVYIPNAFTPDTDPINDKFQIFTTGEPTIDAAIFNRWGELVYAWTKIEDGWDGTFLGIDVQEGIYVYRVKVTTQCEQRTSMGTITLLR